MQPDPHKQPSLDGMRPAPASPPTATDNSPAPEPTRQETTAPVLDSINLKDEALAEPPKKRWGLKPVLIIIFGLVAALVAVAVGTYVWYQQQLSPVSTDTSKHIRVTIEPGSAPSAIAEKLKNSGVIRSQMAFAIYTKLTRTENNLKAGSYNLQPSISTPAIVEHLVKGDQDTFRLTFLPGDTLANNRQKIIKAGYSEAEVDAALAKVYDRPLFEGKPAGADLEGYIFGETYEFTAAASVENILNRTFDEYEAFIKENDLVNGFKKQGFTLYQGITLASIVQREVPSAEDQRQISRVFLNRIAKGMTLGSDVTYQYAAKKMGVDPNPSLDSLYNTRVHTGLPPGPIAAPGAGALRAVANPASNEYLYFLSGDDDVTYYAKTDAEHQRNIVQHCQKKCAIF